MLKVYEKQICLAIAIIVFFVGVCLEVPSTDASFLCTVNGTDMACSIQEESHVLTESSVCTLNMIHNGTASLCRSISSSLQRYQGRAMILLGIVGMLLQYLFFYQNEECKEDGQLFLCRSVVVHYIHQKDGEK